MLPSLQLVYDIMENKAIRFFYAQGFLSSMFSFIVYGFVINAFLLHIGFAEFELGIYGSLMHLGFMFTLLGAYVSRQASSKKAFYIRYYSITIVLTSFFLFLPYAARGKYLFVGTIIFLFLINASVSFAWSVIVPYMHDVIPGSSWDNFYGKRLSIMALPGLTAIFFGNILDGRDTPVYTSIFIFAILCLVLMLYIMHRLPETPKDPESSATPEESGNSRLIVLIKRNRIYRFVFLYGFVSSFSMGLFYPLRYKYIIDYVGISLSRVSVYEFIGMVSSIIACILWGRYSKEKNHLVLIFFLGLTKTLEPALWLLVGRNDMVLYVIYILFGSAEGAGFVGSGLWMVMLNYLLSNSNKKDKTIIFNYNIMIKSCAFIIASFTGGYLANSLQGKDLVSFIPLNNLEYVVALALIASLFSGLCLIVWYKKLRS